MVRVNTLTAFYWPLTPLYLSGCEVGVGESRGPLSHASIKFFVFVFFHIQSIVSLASSLMTNWLTVVAKVFSNTLILMLQKCE